MRAVVQRVSQAAVALEVDGHTDEIARIGHGFLILLGVGHEDTEEDCRALADRVAHLRVMEDSAGKMNLSILETGGAALVISNFTLYGDCWSGRRPSFIHAARPPLAESLYARFGELLAAHGMEVQYGRFGATMQVLLVNSGPVTLLLDSRRAF